MKNNPTLLRKYSLWFLPSIPILSTFLLEIQCWHAPGHMPLAPPTTNDTSHNHPLRYSMELSGGGQIKIKVLLTQTMEKMFNTTLADDSTLDRTGAEPSSRGVGRSHEAMWAHALLRALNHLKNRADHGHRDLGRSKDSRGWITDIGAWN